MKSTYQKYFKILLPTTVLALFLACEKPLDAEYQQDARVYFFERANDLLSTRITTRSMSFLLVPSTVLKDTAFIKIKTMGNLVNQDRFAIGTTIAKGTTAVEGVDYRFLPSLIKANENQGYLAIELLRTTRLKTEEVVLNLAIGSSADFKAGVVEDEFFTLRWTDRLAKPDTWPLAFGTYSDVKYRFVIDILGIADFPAQASARVPLNPGEFSVTDITDFRNRLIQALAKYNLENPTKPLIDEVTGLPITI